ncbi:GntR family transcriptional regulator [Schaalia naturae]|uniref:GntR family transcriptional regulator n=1 Tax=Schaalia naturae TaxID=635203 RepID=A0ABW2SJ75_9ACTO
MKKYDLIAKDLSALIATKNPGDRIPSEQELVAQYAVSAMTIRRALQVLLSAGRIEGIPGKGTFVRTPTVMRSLSSNSFTEAMRAAGKTASSRLVSASITAATDREREALGLAEDGYVIRIERVRLGDDVPLCHEIASLPAERFPGLLGQDLEGSLYALLRQRYSTVVARSRFEVEATLPGAEAAAHLSIARQTPCLRTLNDSWDEDGAPVEHTISLYRGDSYHLVLESGRQPASGS